ncbi:MAG TPA: hypothetical protein VGM06_18835 [Polyangiaceae bacterium]|jgi:hypothetical protein
MTTIQTPVFSSDPYTQLAMMATQVDEQDRSIARETEDTADAAADESEQNRVAEMRAKAQDAESSALVSGITGMAGGLCGLVGAFVPSGGEAAAPDASGPAAGRVAAGAASLSPLGRALDAGSRLIPNVGGVAAAVYTGNAGNDDAAAAQDEADAQADLRQATRAHDDLQAARSSLDKVTQFLDETQQSENAARLAAVSVRG